jgi:hypothetical protein
LLMTWHNSGEGLDPEIGISACGLGEQTGEHKIIAKINVIVVFINNPLVFDKKHHPSQNHSAQVWASRL